MIELALKFPREDGPVHLIERRPAPLISMPTLEEARVAVLGRGAGNAKLEDAQACLLHRSPSPVSLRAWQERDPVVLLRVLRGRRRTLGVLAETYLLGAFDDHEVLFLDLETMGLRDAPVFLVGAGYNAGDSFVAHQFLARSLQEEKAMLLRALDMLKQARVIITYNGRRADLAWLTQRFRRFGIDWPAGIAHLDLLVLVRQVFGSSLPNCKLSTVEDHLLGIHRQGDLPGRLVPPAYQAFLDSASMSYELIEPILQHNRQDIEALVHLVGRLWAERDSEHAIYDGAFKPTPRSGRITAGPQTSSKVPWRPAPAAKRLAPERASSNNASMP